MKHFHLPAEAGVSVSGGAFGFSSLLGKTKKKGGDLAPEEGAGRGSGEGSHRDLLESGDGASNPRSSASLDEGAGGGGARPGSADRGVSDRPVGGWVGGSKVEGEALAAGEGFRVPGVGWSRNERMVPVCVC